MNRERPAKPKFGDTKNVGRTRDDVTERKLLLQTPSKVSDRIAGYDFGMETVAHFALLITSSSTSTAYVSMFTASPKMVEVTYLAIMLVSNQHLYRIEHVRVGGGFETRPRTGLGLSEGLIQPEGATKLSFSCESMPSSLISGFGVISSSVSLINSKGRINSAV